MNNNTTETIKGKAFFNHQYRRFSIPIDCEIDELWDLFHKVLKIPLEDREKYQLHYQDEEKEYILFASTYELKEAIKYFNQQENPLFRLTITKVDRIKSRIPQNIRQSLDPLYGTSVNDSYQSFVKSFPNVQNYSKHHQGHHNSKKHPYFVPLKLSSYFDSYLLEEKATFVALMKNQEVVKWFKENLKQLMSCSFDLSKYGGRQIETYQVQIQSMIELTKFDEETIKVMKVVADNWKNRIIMIRSQLGSSQLIQFFKNNAFDHLQFLFNAKNAGFLPTAIKPKKETLFSNQKIIGSNPKKIPSDRNSFESGTKSNKFIKTESHFFKTSGPKWSRDYLSRKSNFQNQTSSFRDEKSNLSLFKNFIFNNTIPNSEIQNDSEPNENDEMMLSNEFNRQLQISPKESVDENFTKTENNDQENENSLEKDQQQIEKQNILLDF
ncbi:sequestosome-1 [Anaeramoeba flamelloides]|uniref:Sequestosome-1 n=1 Tax=Anaeramoeba flamelloides TaxID=1746091 RepID=A0ABQ8Z3E7_9EUKA|nr:sequestosome-1 [Anaeramoeba flamelloides]